MSALKRASARLMAILVSVGHCVMSLDGMFLKLVLEVVELVCLSGDPLPKPSYVLHNPELKRSFAWSRRKGKAHVSIYYIHIR